MNSRTFDGRVVKAVASKFFVDTADGVKVCFARKKLKADGIIFVGDYVCAEKDRDAYVIDKVYPRKNALVRPYVSNVDVCVIVVAPEPEPDFLLVDKIIVNCLEQGIKPVIAANKSDIATLSLSEYNNVCKVVSCSAETGAGIDSLVSELKGHTACFAGQSAVGKSSIINAVLENPVLQVGALAGKIKRGRHTTRKTEIISLGEDTYLVDTCGFSMLDTVDVPPEELRLYYDDFEAFRRQCRFNTCTHTDEPDCAVKSRVGKEIGEGRYNRYKLIYMELDERRKNKYD